MERCDNRDRPDHKEFAAWLLPAAFWIVLSCAVVSFILISLTTPNGDWDGMTIWNMRARFLARGTDHWRNAFVASPGLWHPDYPLLLSATIARCWKYVGHEPVVVPIAIAFLFTFSSVAMLWSSLAFLRNSRVGYLGGIVLLSAYSFVGLGAGQYADAVAGLFILSAIVILAVYDSAPTKGNRGLLVLAGVAAGLCAWTKNEGLLFVVLLLAVRGFVQLKMKGAKLSVREFAPMMAGLLPVLAVITYFKLGVAPGNYYLKFGADYSPGPMQQLARAVFDNATVKDKLTDISRYWLIAKTMLGEISRFGGRIISVPLVMLVYFVCRGKEKSSISDTKTGIAILALMLVGYCCVYLTTPLNLAYHLNHSLSRLLLQVWPSAVFLFFMATSSAKLQAID